MNFYKLLSTFVGQTRLNTDPIRIRSRIRIHLYHIYSGASVKFQEMEK
jgi:hypothetical protein